MIFSPQQLIQLEQQFRYAILLPGMIVEGPIVTVIAGFLSSTGVMNAWIVYPISVLGDIIGDTMLYAVGRFGGISFIRKYGMYVGIFDRHIERLEEHFKHRSLRMIFFGKLAHGIGAGALASAGIGKMPYQKYFFWTLGITLIKSLAFVLIGYFAGAYYLTASSTLNLYTVIVTLIVIVVITTWFIPRWVRKQFKDV